MQPFDRGTHPAGLQDERAAASARLDGAALPSWELEEWRYSPIADLALDRYAVVGTTDPLTSGELAALQQEFGVGPLVVTRNGHVIHQEGPVDVLDGVAFGGVAGNGDLFADMNAVFAEQTIVVRAKAGAMVDDITIVHLITEDQAAVFTRLIIDAAESSAVRVHEVHRSEAVDALVVPHIEVKCGPAANVGYVGRQHLGESAWQIGSQLSEVGQQGTFRSSIAAFGGHYARLRSDCRLEGRGAHGDLDAIYFGDGEQILDFRTFQDHNAPDTTSNLLFKGVVDDSSRAIYTGLIRVAEAARGTQAYQTNRNIKLGENSWAESVPNLEIETDDVRCSHASTVGPIDEIQRFYLETRGVPPEIADRLIVSGFFDEVIEDLPIKSVAPAIHAAVEAKLAKSNLAKAAA